MISVVIPAYNAALYIGEAIDSVLNQGSLLSELIVVDDNSSDETSSIVRAYNDKRIKILSRAPSDAGGVSAVRNAGLSRANGEWVLFLDADDVLMPNALDTLYAAAKKSSCAAVYGDYQRINSNGQPIGFRALFNKRTKPTGDISTALLEGNFIVNGGVMLIRKTAFNAIGGFNEHIRYCEDWLAWCRLSFDNTITYLPGTCVLQYRVHQTSTMMKKRLRFEDCLPALEAVFSDPLITANTPFDDLIKAQRKAESHMLNYVCAQDIRARRYMSALRTTFENLRTYPSGARRTLMSVTAAVAGF